MMRRGLLIALLLSPPIAHADDGGDQFRALVCVIDRGDGRPCRKLDAEALARVEAIEALGKQLMEKHRAAVDKLRQSKADGASDILIFGDGRP